MYQVHWKMLILKCSQRCYRVKIRPSDLDLWQMILKINRVPDYPKGYVCTKFGQNTLKNVDSRVFTRMLCCKNLTRWPMTLKINRFQILLRVKYVSSSIKIQWRMIILECSQGWYAVKIWPVTLRITRIPDSFKD
jgi:hypothetical protein